jgi:hypothetical protein
MKKMSMYLPQAYPPPHPSLSPKGRGDFVNFLSLVAREMRGLLLKKMLE